MRLERHAEEPPENHGTRPRLFIGGYLGAHTHTKTPFWSLACCVLYVGLLELGTGDVK